jgi:hypothetical protein
MSQNSPLDSGAQSSKTPGLKPALSATLASLEVHLDQELARYRRTRHGSFQPKSNIYISHQTLSWHDMTTGLGKTQPPTAKDKPTVVFSPPPVPTTDDTTAQNHQPGSDVQEFADIHPPVPNSSHNPAPLLKTSRSIVPTKAQPPENEPPLQPEEAPKQPDDYLESSEALLRSLTEEQQQTTSYQSSSESLLSPLGIGSMLLLLLASVTLGYVVLNPKTLPLPNLGGLSSNNTLPAVDNSAIEASNSQSTAAPEITPIPKYPNLAAREFPEVRDANDIVGLKPKVQPAPVTTPNTIAVPPPPDPVQVINSVSEPLPQISVQATPTPPVLSEDIKPSGDGYYHIVTDYQGKNSFAAARLAVPDAYLSPNQKYIYLASVKTKEEVKQTLQQLEAKGIQARVQEP